MYGHDTVPPPKHYVLHPEPKPQVWDGMPYLTNRVVRASQEQFQEVLAQLRAAGTLKAHIEYLNNTPFYIMHPVSKMTMNEYFSWGELRNLTQLIPEGLDLARSFSRVPLYLHVIKSVRVHNEADRASFIESFLTQKAQDPRLVEFVIKAFDAWTPDQMKQPDVKLAQADPHLTLSTYLKQIGKFPLETQHAIFAGLKSNQIYSLFNQGLEALEQTSPDRKFFPLWGLFGSVLTRSDEGIRRLIQFLRRCNNDQRLEIFDFALQNGEAKVADMALARMVKPLNPLEEAKLKTLIKKFIPEAQITISNILAIPLWRVHSLFTRHFKQYILRLTDLNTLQLYFYTLRLEEELNYRSLEDFYVQQLKAFKELGCLSEETAKNLEKPVFAAIQSDNLGRYSKELLLSLGAIVMCAIPSTMSQEFYHLIYYIVHHVHLMGSLIKELKLESITIFDGGSSRAQWIELLSNLLDKKNTVSLKFSGSGILKFSGQPTETINLSQYTSALKFVRLQGRTLIFQMPNSDEWLAIKIQKKGEKPSELLKEAQMQQWVAEHKQEQGLQSDYPTLVKCAEANTIVPMLNQFLTEGEKAWLIKNLLGPELDKKQILIYRAKPGYFTYLHEIVDSKDFNSGAKHGLHDLCVMLKQGIYFDRLADMYHNREAEASDRDDGGRYDVLNDILMDGGTGAGRLNAWLMAIEYVNLRETGLADLGDMKFLDEDIFPEHSEFRTKFLKNISNTNTESRIFLNCIAEYLYVFFLVVGRRARIHTLGKNPENAFPIWVSNAELILELCAHALHVFTHEDEHLLLTYLKESIDFTRLARQMQFWMTKEYIPHVKNNTIPPEIFGSDVELQLDFSRFRKGTFNDKYGCCINPNEGPDLGTVNGQEPLKEMNKLLYIVAITVYSISDCQNDFTRQANNKLKLS